LQDRGEADRRDRVAGRCRHTGFHGHRPGESRARAGRDQAHADNLFALQDAQAAAVFRTVARVARAIRDAFAPQGLSVYQANGKAAGQTVFHFHVHLVPRHESDGMNLSWPVKNPPREKLEEYAAKIRQKLR